MKGRESGMPDEALWASFFDVGAILDHLLPSDHERLKVVEFGCGYGTFTLPMAARTTAPVTALDIEPAMVSLVRQRARAAGFSHVRTELPDFVEQGTGLGDATQDYAMVFNLLHIEEPVALLREAWRVLRSSGMLSVIHWRSDIDTPRGPPLDILPSPEQCASWMAGAGFTDVHAVDLGESAPFHFGALGVRSG